MRRTLKRQDIDISVTVLAENMDRSILKVNATLPTELAAAIVKMLAQWQREQGVPSNGNPYDKELKGL